MQMQLQLQNDRTCRANGFNFFVCPRIDLIVARPHFEGGARTVSVTASVMKYGSLVDVDAAGACAAALVFDTALPLRRSQSAGAQDGKME